MEASRYEPLSTVEPHLTWASWDILTLCLVLVAGAYVVSTLWELGFGQVSSVLKQIEQLNQESVAHALLVLGILVVLVWLVGSLLPLRGGRGYDYKMHDPVSFGVALVRSGDKMATLFEVVAAAGLICFRLVADTLTLLDLYQRTDIRAFSIKLTMIGLAASWAAMWVYPQTPTNWMYMPPLALQSGQLMCLPCCMALLTFFQLLPACILLLCFILLPFSDTAEEVERAMDMLRLPQVFEALQRASLLTETVPVFFLNIFLLAGPELSPTSWSFLYISTLIDGCFLVKTFAQIDCFGHVSHFVNGLPSVVGTVPSCSALFAFVVVYRGATLVTNCLLPLVFQNAVDITWAGFPAALGLLAVDLALQMLQVFYATGDWKKLLYAMWALLTPPEPLLHSGQPLFACKPRIWIVAKAALYALCLGSLGSDIYASGSDLADPVLHIVVVTMAIQWPLFVALRNAAYPLSECYCNLQEDSTTAHVPMHLMKIWWVAKQKRILPSSNLQDIGAGVLGRLLEEDDVVTELKVSDNGIGPEGAESLFSALLSNETLTQLYLDGNPIGPDGLKLLPFLAKGPDKMIGSCDGYRKCLELSRSLDAFAGSSPLQLLSLSRTQLGSKLHPLAQFLSRTPTLKKLYLNDNGIGEAGARVLAEGLRANESLDVLTMNKNQLHDGVLIILQALAMPHGDGQLSTLYVAENHINNGILEDMLQVLPSIPCLKKLNLARNPFSLHVLTEALTRGVVLPELRVTARDQSGKDAVQYMRDLGTMVEVD